MPLLDDLFRRRALWVTGKGGTGKSTISASLALLASRRGMRTLVIDVEANGDAARFLDASSPRYEAREAQPSRDRPRSRASTEFDARFAVCICCGSKELSSGLARAGGVRNIGFGRWLQRIAFVSAWSWRRRHGDR